MMNTRRTRALDNIKPTAMSAASMGRVVVLLATSCAAFQSRHSIASSVTRPHLRSAASSSRFQDWTSHRHGFDRNGALRYRDGDEDQPIDMQIANAGAVAQQVSTGANGRASTPTRSWVFPVRLLPSSSATTEIDERQVAMEEYLDYVERRYNRLHQGAVSRPRVVLDSPSIDNSLTKPSCLSSLDQFEFMMNNLQTVTITLISSLRIMTNFRIIPEILKVGFSVASFAILLMFRPLLKGAFRQG
eukprot:CAMPEP_0201868096 /NCGR_PEP_ID=MMETSP0902-20130614/2123_1 /ASSEMBLY_ACC=CAM_ASM_000551 /TAXON_ID=420261 /ORGANISM="Thalassiosira antarctica, Strain CCMP982" /LENGTH=244 /DNA_ID=CAMNT_0048393395 /DNA_START=157 /DNA_END=891 /DNA_ORIENTATION=-